MQDLKEMGDRFELRMGNREVAMLIGGLFVMLVVAFSLGVMMGKKLYVGAANGQEPAQTAAVSTPGTPGTSQEPTPSQPPPEPKTPAAPGHATTEEQYSFPDTLKNLPATSPGANKPPAATTPEPAPATTPGAPKTPTPSTPPPDHATVPKTPPKTEPVMEPEPNPKKTPAVAAPSGAGPWTIQVAAVADKKRADDYMKQLKAKGLEAWISPLQGTEKIFYRVRIGHFPTAEAATEERDKLKTAGTIPQDSFVRK